MNIIMNPKLIGNHLSGIYYCAQTERATELGIRLGKFEAGSLIETSEIQRQWSPTTKERKVVPVEGGGKIEGYFVTVFETMNTIYHIFIGEYHR